METLIIHTDQDKLDKIIEFLKSMKVSYEINKCKGKKDKPYNPDFVKKVLEVKNEKSVRLDPATIWESNHVFSIRTL
jgi:hypothetical protein